MSNYVYSTNIVSSGIPSVSILVATQSANGGAWSAPVPITINGVVDHHAADPNVLIAPNGSYLLSYTYGPFSDPNGPSSYTIYTAVSTDGINFTSAQPAFTNPRGFVSDPTEVRLPDGTYLAAVSIQPNGMGTPGGSNVTFYSSTDGRAFVATGTTLPFSHSVCDLLVLPNGNVRNFYFSSAGILSEISSDGGHTWTAEAGLRLAGAYQSPSVVQTGPSQWEMVVGSIINPSLQSTGPDNQQISLATSTDGLNFTLAQSNFELRASVPEIVASPVVVPDITSAFAGPSSHYTLSVTGNSSAISVLDKVGSGGNQTLTNVQKFQFTDQTLDTSWFTKTASLSASQITNLTELYIASFNRAPDALGLDYWGSQLSGGMSRGDIAASFFVQPEAAAAYPAGQSTQTFVNQVYGNVLGRQADAAGLNYWVGQLQSGSVGKNSFLLAIINGVIGADVQYLANKEAVGAHFALAQGLSDATWAKTIMSGVNGTAASVTAANAQTDSFAATAATAAGTELVVKILGIVA